MTETAPPRVVYDCNILFQSLIRTGPAARCLELVELGRVQLLISSFSLAEAAGVFARPKVRAKYPELTDARITRLFELLRSRCTMIATHTTNIELPRDPKDIPYLELALIGRADYLVTRDHDLLDLSLDASTPAANIRQLLPNLRILEPQDFIRNFQT
ncbi:MAG TPA: putative toxin-antitoxin system toxin component, PIN family [Tepidisphaeraceae bacterium]|jgi:putative PIN family toxin of toxin-antitoxin system|nr:putative toxin-antitoxin system toxin component, PIN family [Tepidisphaeraceae bacterium]